MPTSVPKPTRSVPQIPIADDIIAIENAASLVAAQFHRHTFRDAGADHVPDGGSAKVVRNAAWAASGYPGPAPRMVEAAGPDRMPGREPDVAVLTAATMKDCRWLKPVLVAQIEFLEWTGEDHLRHTKVIALRDDKPAQEVRRE